MRYFTFTELTNENEIRELIAHHNANSAFCVLDTETTDKDPRKAVLLDIQMSGRTPDSAVIFKAEFAPLLKELRCMQVWQNFGYDWTVLARHGVNLQGARVRDPLLISHLYDENRHTSCGNSLDTWVQELFGDAYKETFWKDFKNYQDAPRPRQIDYACKDIIYTGRVYLHLLNRLRKRHIPESLVVHVHRLATALFDTELKGLAVDLQYLTEIGAELKPSIERWKGEMRDMARAACTAVELDTQAADIAKVYSPSPRAKAWQRIEKQDFNWDSNRQLTKLLYDKLKLPPRYNKARNYSADDKALESLEHLHPVIPMIREYKGYQKVYTSFIEGTLERVQNGRIYPRFNINGTVTGRISSSDPNLQQLPSKGVWAKVRGIYCAEADHCIVTCDYGQLEVCIAAHFSLDPNLLKIVLEGASKHDITAQALGIDRSKAKTLNFAMQYQCSPKKVSEILGCSMDEAQLVWNKYWETYGKEKEVIDACKRKVDNGEPIVNPFGRCRRFPTHFDKAWQKEKAYRQAYSALIQGTGSDCTHEAFYTVAETMQERGSGRALFEVHDEIIAMSKKTHYEDTKNLLQCTMTAVGVRAGLKVPLTTDCSGALERWEK